MGSSKAAVGEWQITGADVANWPWVSRFEWQTIGLDDFPNLKRWYVAVAERPAVQRGYDVPKRDLDVPMP